MRRRMRDQMTSAFFQWFIDLQFTIPQFLMTHGALPPACIHLRWLTCPCPRTCAPKQLEKCWCRLILYSPSHSTYSVKMTTQSLLLYPVFFLFIFFNYMILDKRQLEIVVASCIYQYLPGATMSPCPNIFCLLTCCSLSSLLVWHFQQWLTINQVQCNT